MPAENIETRMATAEAHIVHIFGDIKDLREESKDGRAVVRADIKAVHTAVSEHVIKEDAIRAAEAANRTVQHRWVVGLLVAALVAVLAPYLNLLPTIGAIAGVSP